MLESIPMTAFLNVWNISCLECSFLKHTPICGFHLWKVVNPRAQIIIQLRHHLRGHRAQPYAVEEPPTVGWSRRPRHRPWRCHQSKPQPCRTRPEICDGKIHTNRTSARETSRPLISRRIMIPVHMLHPGSTPSA